jgi:ferric-dicitrate binding protein FerR (iron transport regulator)
MHPDERVEIGEKGIARTESVDASDYITWVDGVWTLNGKALKDVLGRLSAYYGQAIYFDPVIGEEPVYGKLFLSDDLGKILEWIGQTLSLQHGEGERNNYLIYMDDEPNANL